MKSINISRQFNQNESQRQKTAETEETLKLRKSSTLKKLQNRQIQECTRQGDWETGAELFSHQ